MQKPKIKKVFFGCCAAAVSLAMLAGCQFGKESAKNGDIVEISIGDIPTEETNPKTRKIALEKFAEFEKNNPNIKITPDSYSFSPDTYTAMAEAGTLPTTYYLPFTQASLVIDMGYAADVTQALKKYNIYDQINDTILEKISRNGKIYLIPKTCYDSGLAFNMKVMKEAGLVNEDGTPKVPTTWEELAQTAKTIKEKTGKAGLVIPTTQGTGGWRFMPIAWSYGAKFEEKVDGKWVAKFDSPECAEALQFIKDLKWKYDVLPANSLVDAEEVLKTLGTGGAGMTFLEPGQMSKCVSYGMNLEDVGFAQMPAGPKEHVTLLGGAYQVIRSDATEEQIDAVVQYLIQTGILSTDLTEDAKENINGQIDLDIANNNVVGAETITPWKSDCPAALFRSQLIKERANINLNYVKLYNDKTGIKFREEEPIATSALYRTLSSCIQEVLTNKDADCAKVLKDAAADFQKNQLDPINK